MNSIPIAILGQEVAAVIPVTQHHAPNNPWAEEVYVGMAETTEELHPAGAVGVGVGLVILQETQMGVPGVGEL